jgi:hypothetical protein
MDLNATLTTFIEFINTSLIPLLIAIALLVFLWNATRYFIIGGAEEESREKAKSLAIWGILAFVVITGVWGIVNIVIELFGFGGTTSILPDYMKEACANPTDAKRVAECCSYLSFEEQMESSLCVSGTPPQ